MACAETTDSLHVPRTEAFSRQQTDQLCQLRTDSQWTDVTIHSQGTTFQCHRVILAASSPVLKAMMLSDMVESNDRTITLNDITPTALELLISYIYTGETSVPNDQLLPVTNAAGYLQLTALIEYCLLHALTVLAPSNAISWYLVADKQSADELKDKCLDMLASSLSDVCHETEFLELSFAEMSSYVSDAQGTGVDCDDLLAATLGWVDHKADSRQEHLMDLVQKIDISRCSFDRIETEIDRYATLFHSQPRALMKLTKGIVEAAKQLSMMTGKEGRTKVTIAVVGGHEQAGCTVNTTFWYLDPSMQFVDLCDLEECVRSLSVCVTPDGFAVTGGEGSVLCMMFVSSTRSWKKLEDMNDCRSDHGSVFRNGKIYVIGGYVSCVWSDSVQSLELTSEEWNAEPSIPSAAAHPEVVCLEDDIFVLDVKSGQLLRLDTDSWRNVSRRPGGKCVGARMMAVRDQLVILGGNDQLFDSYHPGTQTWKTGRKPILKHSLGAVAFYEEKLYLLGGKGEDRVEEYNFDRESWSVCDCRVPKKLTNLYAVVLDMKTNY